MSKKLITDELINERLEAKGFGEKQSENEELAKESVLNHFGVKFTTSFNNDADFSIYEEGTADGYSVWIAAHDPRNISICEDVYYYDTDLADRLAEFIQGSNGDEDYPEYVYVDDDAADFIDYAIEQVFIYQAERLEEQVIDELIDEGYEEQN